ncbi:MAG: hypothetical protein ACEPOV_10695 [Hyphomicrobiales bacterium]
MELESLLSEEDYNKVMKLLRLKNIIFYVTYIPLFILFIIPKEYLPIEKEGNVLNSINNYILIFVVISVVLLIAIDAINIFKCKREKDLSKKIAHVKKSYWNRILIFIPLLTLTASNYIVTGNKSMIVYFLVQIMLCNTFMINKKSFTKLLNTNDDTLTNS